MFKKRCLLDLTRELGIDDEEGVDGVDGLSILPHKKLKPIHDSYEPYRSCGQESTSAPYAYAQTQRSPSCGLSSSSSKPSSAWVSSTSGWSPPLVVTGQHRCKLGKRAHESAEDLDEHEPPQKVKPSSPHLHRHPKKHHRKEIQVVVDEEDQSVLEGMAKRLKLSTNGGTETSNNNDENTTEYKTTQPRPTCFIDQDLAPHEEHEVDTQWNDWNYWKLPLPALIDLEEDGMHGE
eukprot:TRINITY_DN11040_c0_g1_i1.p1 TRINITY_DN11040_c0_g1~~TRINITY_DN11040_c0_g1_i1.p1  ORF type:complete len:234 (+),score=61.44 TRINITY_DN11040_c0_g1_i1:206-907(+)